MLMSLLTIFVNKVYFQRVWFRLYSHLAFEQCWHSLVMEKY